MRRLCLVVAVWIAMSASIGVTQDASKAGPYKVVKTVKVGGEGGFDHLFADGVERRLYIPRTGPTARVTIFNLDTLESVGKTILNISAPHDVAIDPKSGHGFSSSKPVVMWDIKTLAIIKTIDVPGNPDGIVFDPFTEQVWFFSPHSAPSATVLDAKDGSVVGTVDDMGAAEQAVTDGKGHLYVDILDRDSVAVVDTKTHQVTGHYDLASKAKAPVGLAFDAKNHVLFAACRNPTMMVILDSDSGKIITALPLGRGHDEFWSSGRLITGSDGVIFNPATMEAFSSQGDGTLTVIKENSPTSFVVEQTLETKPSAKTETLDTRTNQILLIAAEYGPPFTPPARGGPGRGVMVPDSFSILVVGK